MEYVHSGKLGKILYVIGTCYKPRQSIGKLDKPLEIPSTIDYDLWCGPAAKVDLYRPKLHYDWHWDYNTGNGDMGNQGIHQMDIARWFLGAKTLSPRVVSFGGRLGYEDAGNTANTQVVLHDYPERPLIFETRGLPKSKALNWRSGDGQLQRLADRRRRCSARTATSCRPRRTASAARSTTTARRSSAGAAAAAIMRTSSRPCKSRKPERPERRRAGRAPVERAVPHGRDFAPVGRAAHGQGNPRVGRQERAAARRGRADVRPPARPTR